MMTATLPKSYTPAQAEPEVRARWDAAGAFHADPSAGGEPFCILIPPPNVTAALHLGHAFNNTLQDILTRYHRLRGFNTLWMPGTDHAGIATQAVVEKRLLLQGKRRTDFSRSEFIAKVQAWKDEYEATIIEQLKAMGCSCDFARTRFTMDEVCARAVREAFFRLFKDGLIYRGKRLVNWDPVSQTALADDEVEMEEVQGQMWYLRYPLHAGSEPSEDPDCVVVATTRPETMLGDTAVAMNPRDPRAPGLVGKKVRLPIVNRIIPIVADDYVVMPGGDDPKSAFATGFLKVTPAHDENDYQIGQRHNLPVINVFAPDATISDKHGWTDVSEEARPLLGLSREQAREAVVKWFKDHGLLEDVKPYTHSVGHSYRSNVPIEPYLSDQWYVKVTDPRMAGSALRAMAPEQREGVSEPARPRAGELPFTEMNARHEDVLARSKEGDGELRFFPARYAKTFQSWHENLRDWCISRQLWWGHRIPVWRYTAKTQEGHRNVGKKIAEQRFDEILQWQREDRAALQFARLGVPGAADYGAVGVCIRDPEDEDADLVAQLEAQGFERDPDVLDTWFSSALWPISTMGWPSPGDFPEEIPEGEALLNTFNPSSVLCTAREIITLWVSRMVMFNRYFRDGRLPFRHVYIHAMIQDGHGQKMSKSLGNGVDPRDIIHGHGADAMRFVLTQMATNTQDARMPVDMICPHPACGHAFEPRQITSPAGSRVADAVQTCPKCQGKMVSGYGAASGAATPSKDIPLARNTSTKFDLGRNFANKLWNATRFALSNLPAEKAHGEDAVGFDVRNLALVDKWIISRLHRTLHAVEDALAEYQFNAYADAMYDFVWRDFCDWYLEAIKSTVKDSPGQQQVLRTVLNAILRLLHPIMPFVTEALWPHVASAGIGAAGLDGITLGESELLATAPWPDIACRVEDKAAAATFERAQSLINAIRQVRSDYTIPDRKRIGCLHAPAAIMALIDQAAGVVQALARLERVETLEETRSKAAGVRIPFEGFELVLSGLVGSIDLEAETARLTKIAAEKQRIIAGLRAKLENSGYVNKAPASVVEQTRLMLVEAEKEHAAAESALKALAT